MLLLGEEEKDGYREYAESPIRSKILLICHFSSFLFVCAKNETKRFAIGERSALHEDEVNAENLTGTEVRRRRGEELKYQHGIYFVINPLFGVLKCDN